MTGKPAEDLEMLVAAVVVEDHVPHFLVLAHYFGGDAHFEIDAP
jgi:hypothetical protein